MNGRPVYPAPPPPARLTLVPEGSGSHRVDGAWWPRTRDLHRELPPLLRALEPRWGDIRRVTVHAEMWRPGLRWIQLPERMIHIYRSEAKESRHSVCLLTHGMGRCDLLVVPPPTAPAAAERLLAAAMRPRPHSAQPSPEHERSARFDESG